MTTTHLRWLRPRRSIIGAAAAASIALAAPSAFAEVEGGGEEHPQPVDFTHNIRDTEAPVAGAVFGSGPSVKTGTAICTTATQTGANANTDCDGANPHNETSIAVNPTDQSNIIGGANDYQLGLNPGGHVSASVLSRAHVSFDGGKTWSEYPIFSNMAYQGTGDPALAFDDAGNAYYGTLGFRFVGPVNATNPDVLVSSSSDKGKTWSTSRIASGSGTETSVGDLLDKEYVAAWGDGNAIVTYGDFRLGQKGSFISAKIYASVTHNAGQTWSTPRLISGSLDQAFVSVPTVTSDGRIYVAFLNTTHPKTGRDSYEVVQVDPQSGGALGNPVEVAKVFDGAHDYPIGLGSQTYQDSIFRSWAAGNITADPTNPDHLAVVWSDMRNSALPAPRNPYKAVTNSDVVVSQSTDGGQTWSSAKAIALRNDQWMPWGAYDLNGMLRIGTFDRSQDSANHVYNYSLLTEQTHASLSFGSAAVLSTATSDPTKDNRWFAATVNPDFPFATSFLGDYSNIAATADGGVVAYWTDLRNDVTFAGRTGHGQDAYFAKHG